MLPKLTPAQPSPLRDAKWWLGLLMVLALAAGLVGTPLQRHHADPGIHGAGCEVMHSEHDHAPGVCDAGRVMSSALQSPGAERHGSGAVLIAVLVPPPSAAAVEDPATLSSGRFGDNGAPPFPTPLSRPPEGRAPPLRA